jgi:hypothetical protein
MIIHNNIFCMNLTFTDILDANLLRVKYREYEGLMRTSKTKELLGTVKDFLHFVERLKSHVGSTVLMRSLEEQERVAKRLITTIRVRYLLLFLYKRVIQNLINRLVSLMRSLLIQLSF